MPATCTATKNGGSMSVALPAEWRRANGVKAGDVLEVRTDVCGQITFCKPAVSERIDKLNRLFEAVDALPKIQWEGGQSPADDKRVLGERCAF